MIKDHNSSHDANNQQENTQVKRDVIFSAERMRIVKQRRIRWVDPYRTTRAVSPPSERMASVASHYRSAGYPAKYVNVNQ